MSHLYTSARVMEGIAEHIGSEHEAAKETAKKISSRLAERIEGASGYGASSGQVPDVPDHPPCDHCGKEFEGKLSCARCACVFYCSKECQKAHWKSGHKNECDNTKEKCENAARKLVDVISGPESTFVAKLQNPLWESIDGAGAYKIALDYGFNGAIQKLMKEDIKNAEKRFSSGLPYSYTQQIMCTAFRGGRHIKGSAFSSIDAYRVKKYLRSSEDAFETWFEASIVIFLIFQKQGMAAAYRGDFAVFWKIQEVARDVGSAWGYVFTSKKASKAVLLGASKQADASAQARAKWILKNLKKVVPHFPEDSPDNSSIEGLLCTFTAMMQIRLEEFGVDVGDFVALTGLKGRRKGLYHCMAIPFATATIAKGRSLTHDECPEAIRAHAKSQKETPGGKKSDSSKKKGKKKGKKKR